MEITRRHLLALAGLGGVGLLAGCAGTLPEADVAASGFGEGATGRVQLWTRSATQTGIQTIVDRFHRAQSRIRVDVTPVLDGQYVTKLATAIRGGSPPDLVDIDDINSTLFAYRDVFTDVTPLVKDLPYLDSLSPGHLGLATIRDRVYGVPFLADVSVLWCNTELFERAGVDLDEAATDLPGLLEASEKISRLGDDTYGWSFPGNAAGALGFTVQPNIWADGSRLTKGTIGSQTGDIDGNAALQGTLEFFKALWDRKAAPPAAFSDDASRWGSDYFTGKIGVFPSSYGTTVLRGPKSILEKTRAILIPGPSGGRSFFDGGDNLCIPRGAQNPSAAWEFTRYALELAQQQGLPEGGYSPVRADANTAAFAKRYPFATPPLERLDAGYAPKTLPYNLLYNQVDGPFLRMFRRAVFTGDIAGAMDAAQADYDRILEQAQT